MTSNRVPFSSAAKLSSACLPAGFTVSLAKSNSESAEKLTRWRTGGGGGGGGGGEGGGGRGGGWGGSRGLCAARRRNNVRSSRSQRFRTAKFKYESRQIKIN